MRSELNFLANDRPSREDREPLMPLDIDSWLGDPEYRGPLAGQDKRLDILRFMEASQREIEVVRKQIGTAWGAY